MGQRCDHAHRGQAVPAMALVLWLVAGLVLVGAMLGERAVTRARAQVAADAAALAFAAGGDGVGAAGSNGARVDQRVDMAAGVDVVVAIDDVRAAARARRPRPAWAGLDPALQAALARAEGLLGREIPIVSGLRSRADQERLWANRHRNPFPVAPPGTSLHEMGLAVDVPLALADDLALVAAAAGLCRPLPVTDPVHFVVC